MQHLHNRTYNTCLLMVGCCWCSNRREEANTSVIVPGCNPEQHRVTKHHARLLLKERESRSDGPGYVHAYVYDCVVVARGAQVWVMYGCCCDMPDAVLAVYL